MIDILINLSKVSIKSIFTAKKYYEVLEEDIARVLFIKNLLEESTAFVKENHKNVDAETYEKELKKYAIELFSKYCENARPIKIINSEGYDAEEEKKDDIKYFKYIYDNHKTPK